MIDAVPLQAGTGLTTGLTMVIVAVVLVYAVDEFDINERISNVRLLQGGALGAGYIMAPQVSAAVAAASSGLFGIGVSNLLGITDLSFEQALFIGLLFVGMWLFARQADLDIMEN